MGQSANNPSFRTFEYMLNDFELKDIKYINPFKKSFFFRTYFINLTKLNLKTTTEWSLEYSFKEAYNLSNINNENLNNLVQRLKFNEKIYEKYLLFNSVNWKREKFNSTQK